MRNAAVPVAEVEPDQAVPSGTPWVRFNTAAGRSGVVAALGFHGAAAEAVVSR